MDFYCQEIRTDHLAVDKTSLRYLPGVVVSCGEFLVVPGLILVSRGKLSGSGTPKK
jgi:hypothetical protein